MRGMHSMKVAALKRVEIRKFATDLRRELGLEGNLWFPIMEYVELMIPRLDEQYYFRVADLSELGSSHGLTYRDDEGVFIAIREDVYDRACREEGRDRGTVAHEAGHYHLHVRAPVFARSFGGEIRTCEDPEWQAKCFQGELLVPRMLVKGMAVWDVAEKCGVSYDAAEYQLKLYASGK